jgi:hypothetical protein
MYRAAAQQAVPDEQVLCFGLLTLPGAMKNIMVGQASPLIAMIMRKKAKNKAGGFPQNTLMAVTPTRLISFEYVPRGNKVKIKKKVVEWPRAAVRVAAGEKRKLSQQLFFAFPDGTSMELDAANGFGRYDGFNDPFYAALGLMPSSV